MSDDEREVFRLLDDMEKSLAQSFAKLVLSIAPHEMGWQDEFVWNLGPEPDTGAEPIFDPFPEEIPEEDDMDVDHDDHELTYDEYWGEDDGFEPSEADLKWHTDMLEREEVERVFGIRMRFM